MLVLSRKKNESIVINDDITIVVVEIRGDKVRLGVEAPKEVPVHRREVFDAIHRNEAAGRRQGGRQARARRMPPATAARRRSAPALPSIFPLLRLGSSFVLRVTPASFAHVRCRGDRRKNDRRAELLPS